MQIPNSVIDKCGHGVYLASAQEQRTERARYCCWCTPAHVTNLAAGFIEMAQRKLVIARDGVRANNVNDSTCPNCGSHLHYRLADARHECADCGMTRETHRSLQLKALADAGVCHGVV